MAEIQTRINGIDYAFPSLIPATEVAFHWSLSESKFYHHVYDTIEIPTCSEVRDWNVKIDYKIQPGALSDGTAIRFFGFNTTTEYNTARFAYVNSSGSITNWCQNHWNLSFYSGRVFLYDNQNFSSFNIGNAHRNGTTAPLADIYIHYFEIWIW